MRFSDWELRVATRLRRVGLDSIRNKILTFALLATLIPSFSTAWISYIQNKRSLTEKITEELRTLSGQAGREMDLFAKEQLIDLRVFASSYEVTENIDRLPRARLPALARLTDYLNSVRDRFTAYEELLVLDPDGHVVASSARKPGTVHLPAHWQTDIRNDNPVVGEAEWDSTTGKAVMLFIVPIRLNNQRLLGALTAKLNLATVREILATASHDGGGDAFVITDQGRYVITDRASSPDLMRRMMPAGVVASLRREGAGAVEFSGVDGEGVVGTLRPVPRLNWNVVIDVPSAVAYRQVIRLRNWTITIVAILLLVIGGLAYLLGLLIVRPLNRLTQGAAKVAAGDLAVDLPVVSAGELGYLTEVFNDMVRRLREGREKLELLSITDGLTGLYNRRLLMDRLTAEVGRAERHNHHFALLMVDVDHFKQYNDAQGHLAGDDVLKRVAAILREATREVDTAARFGGEEFAVLLPETGADGASEVAERIRTRIAAEQFAGAAPAVTVSVGVAQFPDHGGTPEEVIANADAALYEAKSKGRNRVERATRRRSTPARQAKRQV